MVLYRWLLMASKRQSTLTGWAKTKQLALTQEDSSKSDEAEPDSESDISQLQSDELDQEAQVEVSEVLSGQISKM